MCDFINYFTFYVPERSNKIQCFGCNCYGNYYWSQHFGGNYKAQEKEGIEFLPYWKIILKKLLTYDANKGTLNLSKWR